MSAANGYQIYVPKGFAQGCQSLTDDAAVLYLISEPFVPGVQTGLGYDDPALAIVWPLAVTLILARDRNWPDLEPLHGLSAAAPRLRHPESDGANPFAPSA